MNLNTRFTFSSSLLLCILRLLDVDLFHFFVRSLLFSFFPTENGVSCFIVRQGVLIHIPTMLWQLDFNVMENGCTQVLKMALLRFGI